MRRTAIIFFTLLSFAPLTPAASADTIKFDFNDATLPDGAGNSAIQTYMRGKLHTIIGPTASVTVAGAAVEKNYTGDNHVVGPVSGTSVTSLTLGNSDGGIQHAGALDGFLYNSNATKFTMAFNFPIYSVSFDYEIFPNGSCGDPGPTATPSAPTGSCSVWPDFTFKAGNGTTSTILHANSLDPSATGYSGLYTHSPVSGATYKEKAPQLLDVSSTFYFAGGVTNLEFYDWPERIGIDNLEITNHKVPEPGTGLLFACAFGLLTVASRRRSLHA